jgi:hypothetical protein
MNKNSNEYKSAEEDYVTKNVGGPNHWIIAKIFLWKQLKVSRDILICHNSL